MLFGQKSDTDVSLLSRVSNLPMETFTGLLPAEGRGLYSGAWVGTRVPAPSASSAVGLRPRVWDPGRQRTWSDGAAGRASREAPRAGDCRGDAGKHARRPLPRRRTGHGCATWEHLGAARRAAGSGARGRGRVGRADLRGEPEAVRGLGWG